MKRKWEKKQNHHKLKLEDKIGALHNKNKLLQKIKEVSLQKMNMDHRQESI
jgi:uncharacterized protein YaaW (UPF0174 family)